jgi:hypothetical protein
MACTRGHTLKLLGLFLVGAVTVLLGELALLVGVVPALMVVYSAFSSAYRQLSGRVGAEV